jgi:hypothetical protein
MTPLPLTPEETRSVPRIAGCYLVYLDDQPYYAGMSRTDMRSRLRAHAAGRGSKMIRAKLAEGRPMYFEYCETDPAFFVHGTEDIMRAESWFMLLHSGEPLPGNLKLDGLSYVGSRDTGTPSS